MVDAEINYFKLHNDCLGVILGFQEVALWPFDMNSILNSYSGGCHLCNICLHAVLLCKCIFLSKKN